MACASNAAQAEDVFESEPFAFRTENFSEVSSALVDPFSYPGEPIAFRSFRIWPNLTLQQEYTDNILVVENNAEPDLVTVIKPSLEIWKSFGRHDFTVQLNSEVRRHWDRQEDNIENYNLSFTGNLEAKENLNIPLRILYRDAHLKRKDQSRANPNQIVKTPLNVKLFNAEAGIVYKPNRLEFSFLSKYEQVRLGNEDLINGGVLKRDNRDVNITEASVEATYYLRNKLSPFLRATYSHEDYINEPQNTVSRNNDLAAVLTGFKLRYKDLVKGYLGFGLENRSYDDPAVNTTTDFSFDTELVWDPSAKTRLDFNAKRSTSEDNILVSGVTQTFIGLGASHEIRKDLFAKTYINFEQDDFDVLNRTDKEIQTGIDLLKIINPHFQVGAGYSYIHKNSSISGLGFDNNVVLFKVKAAL